MGMVQEVIEVAKKDSQDLMMEIYPDKVTLSGDCLISEFGSLTHTTGMKDYQKEQIESLFGNLEEISTDNALLWFDGSDVKARFGKDTTCDGTPYVAGDVTAFTDSHFQVFRDRDGTIKVVGNTDGNTKCEFKLGAVAGNAIGFSNAFVRSGMTQKARTIAIAGGGTKELPEVIDYKDVFHIFIYTLVSRPASDILSYTMSPVDVTECSLPDGTPGFKIKINTANPGDDSTTQWNDALGDICLTNVQGADDSLINIHDGNMTVTDPTGLTKEWKVVGFDAACKDDFRDFLGPAYKVTTQDGTKTACLSVDVGPNGQPEFKINAQAPIPLLFANGMGGGLYYDSGSGKISIKNEFGFPLNQAFKITGAGGLTMMTPSYPPTGGRTTGSESVSVASNPLAALPWTPSGLELVLFIIALCGGLIFVRIKYRKTS